jgi:hypothetical protein
MTKTPTKVTKEVHADQTRAEEAGWFMIGHHERDGKHLFMHVKHGQRVIDTPTMEEAWTALCEEPSIKESK